MTVNEIRKKLFELLTNIGVYIDECDNFVLGDYIEDSITFISFIVEIEREFEIDIPDDFLMMDESKTLEDAVNEIEKLINEK